MTGSPGVQRGPRPAGDGAGGRPAASLCSVPQNWTCKNGGNSTFYTVYILPHFFFNWKKLKKNQEAGAGAARASLPAPPTPRRGSRVGGGRQAHLDTPAPRVSLGRGAPRSGKGRVWMGGSGKATAGQLSR